MQKKSEIIKTAQELENFYTIIYILLHLNLIIFDILLINIMLVFLFVCERKCRIKNLFVILDHLKIIIIKKRNFLSLHKMLLHTDFNY